MEANNKMREEALRWAKENDIKIMRAAYEQYPHCLTEDDLIVELYKDAIDEAKALAWWNDCKYQDALCRLHFPGKFTRGLLSPEIVAIYKAEHPELNKGEGIEDSTNTRTIALNWWRQQSDEYKGMQFRQYQRENFTPATDFGLLTGREIERIYNNIKLSEKAIKLQGIEDDLDKDVAIREADLWNQPTGAPPVKKNIPEGDLLESAKAYLKNIDKISGTMWTEDDELIAEAFASFSDEQNQQLSTDNKALISIVKELKQRNEELVKALEEVVRISDRKHDAWDKAKAALQQNK